MRRPLTGLLLALFVPLAMAWGDPGHEAVATIAYRHLLPAVKARVDAMLAADTDALSAGDFAGRATWADKWRDSSAARRKATHLWHFVDIKMASGTLAAACGHHPPLPTGTPGSHGPPNACVVDKIAQFQAELGQPATSPGERLLALKFLIHFVGDLHQPLHASTRDDGGGNGQAVMYGKIKKPGNLHTYWDRQLVRSLGADGKLLGIRLDEAITPTQSKAWAGGDAAAWALEAHALAPVAYDFTGLQQVDDHQGGTAPMLDASYNQRALPVVAQQLSRAGVRLATVLNGALK